MTATPARTALTVAALTSIGTTGLTLGQRGIARRTTPPIHTRPLTTGRLYPVVVNGGLPAASTWTGTARTSGSRSDAAGPGWQDPHREGKGHVVMQFSPSGELLMTLGTAGVAAAGRTTLDQPCDVVVAGDGTIYVADGHGGQLPGAGPHTTARIVKFAPDGTYLMEWGSHGTGPGQFRTPHAIALDSRGRVVVADRGNDRLQVFDPDGAVVAFGGALLKSMGPEQR